MTATTAIGFFRHQSQMPTPAEMMERYRTIEQICRALGLTPTHFGADDGQTRSEYKKIGSALQKRFLESGSLGFRDFEFSACLPSSNAPGKDSYFSIALSSIPEAQQVSVTISVDEPHLTLGSEVFDSVLRTLSALWLWDYGFGLSRKKKTDPLLLILDGDNDKHSPEDRRRMEKWYACYQPEQRRIRIRDVYPYNIIGPGHLAFKLPDGRTLNDFIRSDPDSELVPLTDRLWSWKVAPDKTEIVRGKLLGTGVIISE